MNRWGKIKSKKNIFPILTVALLAPLGIAAMCHLDDIKMVMTYLQAEGAHPALIATAFAVLPLFFFPITPLLVFVGIRFDFAWGLAIVFLSIPVHLGFAYLAVRSILPGRLQALAREMGYRTERIPKERRLQLAFLFMAVPGLPYSVKNCLLSLGGISFGWYLAIGWLVNGVMSIPFLVLGEAASRWSAELFLAFALVLAVTWFIAAKARRKFELLLQSDPDR